MGEAGGGWLLSYNSLAESDPCGRCLVLFGNAFEFSCGILSSQTSAPQLFKFVWYWPKGGSTREEFLTMSPKIDQTSGNAYFEKAFFFRYHLT